MKKAYVIEVDDSVNLEDVAMDLIMASDSDYVSSYDFRSLANELRNAIPIGQYAVWEAKRDASVKES